MIRAFNRDLPFDEFVREQIAGDSLGSDAAIGFLVTASVLLPGQIGADDVSNRLVRQDALDEIVVNTSQTFLRARLDAPLPEYSASRTRFTNCDAAIRNNPWNSCCRRSRPRSERS